MSRRRLLNVLAGLSVGLAAVTVFLWVRGYYRSDSVSYWRPVNPPADIERAGVFVGGGTVQWFFLHDTQWLGLTVSDPNAVGWNRCMWMRGFPRKIRGVSAPNTRGLGFDGYGVSVYREPWVGPAGRIQFETRFVTPIWGWLLIWSAAPLAWARHRRRRARPAGPRCMACGYDLRATPDRCPECGTSPAR